MPEIFGPDMQTAEPGFLKVTQGSVQQIKQTEEVIISAADTKAQLDLYAAQRTGWHCKLTDKH